MSYAVSDYDGDTARGEREYQEAEEQREAREAAFDRGEISYAEIAEPIAASLNGWLASQRIAPKYAAIGNGLFVRVGRGRKGRAA
jgi:hypothetical protein